MTQHVEALSIHGFDIIINDERVLGVTTKILNRIDIGIATQRSPMSPAVTLVARIVGPTASFAHHAMANNERRTLLFCLCSRQRGSDGFTVVTVDFNNIPIPRLVFERSVFTVNCCCVRAQLYLIRVIKHDEVVKSEMSGHTPGPLRNFLLDAAVADISINGFFSK